MANKIQCRRGTNAQRGGVTFDSGEPAWTTDTKKLYIGDGTTVGGVEVTGGGGGASSLDGLSDVTISPPAALGDTIIHDGTVFVNANIDTRIMATKLDDFATPNNNTDLDASTGQHGLLPKLGGGTVNFLRADGSWAAPPGAAGGETNTASNQGVAGVGVYYQKDGVDIQFKNINAGSNQISIADDTANHEIDIDVVESNIILDALGVPPLDITTLNSTTSVHGLLPKLGGGTVNFLRADGTWSEPPGAAGGEANTASNVGTAGVGVFKQKTGANLEFKKINAGSSNITITDDVANSEVDIDVSTNVFLVDGSRAMTGWLDMANHDIRGIDDLKAYDTAGITVKDSTDMIGCILSTPTYALIANLPIDMNSKKIENLLDGSAAADAVRYDQVVLIPSGSAQGDILYRDAAGWTRLAAGISGYFLKTLGASANPAWADMGSAAGVFEEAANVIREKSGGGYDNDFAIGSPQLADDGNTAHDARMFFDKSKGAFRAGTVTGANWDDANVGDYSCAVCFGTTASGIGSFASGGTASGDFSHSEGDGTASGNYAHSEGLFCIASGYCSHAAGWGSEATNQYAYAQGDSCISSGSASHSEGYYTYASGNYAHSEGQSSNAYLHGQHAKASGKFAAIGDAQLSHLVARIETTDATANVELFLDGAGSRAVLPANRTWAFSILIAARQTAGSGTVGDSAGYELKGMIKRDGANNTALVGAILKTVLAEDQAAWDVTAVADNTNEALVIKVTGEASKTIHWVATVHLTEVG